MIEDTAGELNLGQASATPITGLDQWSRSGTTRFPVFLASRRDSNFTPYATLSFRAPYTSVENRGERSPLVARTINNVLRNVEEKGTKKQNEEKACKEKLNERQHHPISLWRPIKPLQLGNTQSANARELY